MNIYVYKKECGLCYISYFKKKKKKKKKYKYKYFLINKKEIKKKKKIK